MRQICFSKKAKLHRINNDYTGERTTLKIISGKITMHENEIFNNNLHCLVRMKCTVNQKDVELSTTVYLTVLVKIHSNNYKFACCFVWM